MFSLRNRDQYRENIKKKKKKNENLINGYNPSTTFDNIQHTVHGRGLIAALDT